MMVLRRRSTPPSTDMMPNCQSTGATITRRHITRLLCLALCLASSPLWFGRAAAAEPSSRPSLATAPDDLRVGDRARPLAVEGRPLFSWLPHDPAGNQVQSARQIHVWREGSSAILWDSGKVRSSEPSYVEYAGPPLRPGAAYAWKVRTWNRED